MDSGSGSDRSRLVGVVLFPWLLFSIPSLLVAGVAIPETFSQLFLSSESKLEDSIPGICGIVGGKGFCRFCCTADVVGSVEVILLDSVVSGSSSCSGIL